MRSEIQRSDHAVGVGKISDHAPLGTGRLAKQRRNGEDLELFGKLGHFVEIGDRQLICLRKTGRQYLLEV